MGTVTKSIGSGGGRDYSTLQAWEDALPANLVTDGNAQVGECYNDSEFTAKLSISGQTTNGTNNITLKAASGQSFYDHADKLTNRLAYNQSNGVAVRTTAAYDSAVITISSSNVTIDGLQVKATGLGTWAIQTSGSPTGVIIRKCIASAVSRANINDSVVRISGATSNYLLNSLVIVDSSNACTAIEMTKGANAINCTVVRPSNRTAGGRLAAAANNTSTIKNCAFFGFTTSAAGTYASDGHNVTSHTSAPGSTSNITSAVYANQFVQSSTASSVEDFRIVGTGADLDDAGVTDTTNIPAGDDIVGQTRSTWDVGCWEYVAAGASTGTATVTLDNLTASGAGTLGIAGQSSVTLADATLAATGSLSNRADAAITLDALTLAATGESVSGGTGAASITLDALTVSAAGVLSNRGAATITLADLQLLATGSIANSGLVNVTLDALTLSAIGGGATTYTRAPRGAGYPGAKPTTQRYGMTNTSRPATTNTRR